VIRTQISMSERQAEGLRRLSTIRHRSQAALLRDALDGLLAGEQRLAAIESARAVVGAFSSGTAGTAEAHDVALDDAFS